MKKSVVYTRTGDSGTTSLVGGERVGKDDVRLEAYGTVDELNSWIGLLAAESTVETDRSLFAMIQNRLFDIGGYLATRGADTCRGLDISHIETIENAIDIADSKLEQLRYFVLPGGTAHSAQAQIARTVCRRAERRIVALSREVELDSLVAKFVNRLSDWLFVYARALNARAGVADVAWIPAQNG